MTTIVRSTILGLLVSGVFLACTAVQADEGAWEKFKRFAHQQKTEAVAEGKKMLAATDRQIEAMKKDVKHSTAETKAAHEKNMAELATKRKAAQAELARLEASAAGAWDATRDAFSKAHRDLHEAYQKATASAKK